MNELRESRLIFFDHDNTIGVYQEYTAGPYGECHDAKYFEVNKPIAIFKVKLKLAQH